jgi:hypothetical protein
LIREIKRKDTRRGAINQKAKGKRQRAKVGFGSKALSEFLKSSADRQLRLFAF